MGTFLVHFHNNTGPHDTLDSYREVSLVSALDRKQCIAPVEHLSPYIATSAISVWMCDKCHEERYINTS